MRVDWQANLPCSLTGAEKSMPPVDYSQYFEHETRVSAQRDQDLVHHRAKLAEQTARLTDVLRELGARRIWLFGSLANGRVRLDSDIDMAVEGLGYSQDQLLGIAEQAVEGPLALDLIPWERATPALRQLILDEGRVIYER